MCSVPINLALDVSYVGDIAFAAAIGFSAWQHEQPTAIVTAELAGAARYTPGSFHLRELPCLIAVLERVEQPISVVVIDGYVTLDSNSRPGLGFHLWDQLGRTIPVIGVAKTRYAGTPDETVLLRGNSRRPLHVTAAGIDLAEAKSLIASMHGGNRLPTLLRLADAVARARIHHGTHHGA